MVGEEEKGRWWGISAADRGQGWRGLEDDDEDLKVTHSGKQKSSPARRSIMVVAIGFEEDEGDDGARFFR